MTKLQSRELKATRLGFGEMLVELGEEPQRGGSRRRRHGSVRTDLFAKEFPDRFISVGVAGRDMMCTAVGLAIAGKIPFASAYGEFATGRPFDQIRQSIAYSPRTGQDLRVALRHHRGPRRRHAPIARRHRHDERAAAHDGGHPVRLPRDRKMIARRSHGTIRLHPVLQGQYAALSRLAPMIFGKAIRSSREGRDQ